MPANHVARLRRARRLRERLAARQAELAQETAHAVREAMAEGMSGPAVAAELDVSHQRVYQLKGMAS
jgi:hypothetical protein